MVDVSSLLDSIAKLPGNILGYKNKCVSIYFKYSV